MDVDTLLTRQMELHTSVRQPPKNPQGLMLLMDIMRNYKNYFESLRRLAGKFGVEPETVFQAFMYISVGGSVNFDKQHQDGSVPMHQAKVLTRSNAIELAGKLRKEMPNPELMVYVGLSRDLRTTLRVKVEDGNDLKTAEASVCEAVDYLNYIDRVAHHNSEKVFQLYMAEDPNSLTALINEAGPLSLTQTTRDSTASAGNSAMSLPVSVDDGTGEMREPTPLPTPLSSFLSALKEQCVAASDLSTSSGAVTRRLRATMVVLDWVMAVPSEYFASHAEAIVGAVSTTVSQLAKEKRSALCRVGCEVITVLVERLSSEPVFIEDVNHGNCSNNVETFSGALAQWTASLAKGTYVTVAAISTSSDAALRTVAIQSHGHVCVVKKLLTVLSNGTQTELRRKCLGYLALCVVAAHAQRPERVRELFRLLAPVAVEYVSIGDSPSRKMARALCSVLRVLSPEASPSARHSLQLKDERVEQLVQQERPQVEPAVKGGPRELEELLFEADAFVSSTRSSFSSSSPRNSGMAAVRGRGRGVASRRGSGSSQEGPAVVGLLPTSMEGSDFPLTPSAARGNETSASNPLGELRSPTRMASPKAGTNSAAIPAIPGGARRMYNNDDMPVGPRSSPRAMPPKTSSNTPLPRAAPKMYNSDDMPVGQRARAGVRNTQDAAPAGIYDTDSFLGSLPPPSKQRPPLSMKYDARDDIGMDEAGQADVAAPPLRPSAGGRASDGSSTSSGGRPFEHLGAPSGPSSHPSLPRRGMAHGHALPNAGSERPVPISLRASAERDDTRRGVSMESGSGDAAVAPRVTPTLRRKIVEGKTGIS